MRPAAKTVFSNVFPFFCSKKRKKEVKSKGQKEGRVHGGKSNLVFPIFLNRKKPKNPY